MRKATCPTPLPERVRSLVLNAMSQAYAGATAERQAAIRLGEFNFKVTSTTCQLNEQQLVQLQINVEGRTQDGQVVATVSVSPGKMGQFSVVGVNYQDNGQIITARGQGHYESIGQGKEHRWRTNTTILTSDGRRLKSDGEFDQQNQTWKGRTYSLDE